MGKRGPKRLPTIILRNRGSWKAGTRQNEPVLPVKAPEPPETLSKEARKEWERLCPLLMGAGVLTEADRDVLEEYCKLRVELREVESYCYVNGKYTPMIKTDKGNLVQNPAIGVRNTLRALLRQYMALLGLSPADRSNVKAAPKPEPADAKKRFFKGA